MADKNLSIKALKQLCAWHGRFQNRLGRLLWKFAIKSPYGNTLISTDGNPYLLRVYLAPDRKVLPKFITWRPYLHFFFRGDYDDALHNHPWESSCSLILTGGYKEYRWDPEAKETVEHTLKPGSLNFIRRDDYHRVDLLKPQQGCWTLFLAGRRVQESDGTDWSFFQPETETYTPWQVWVSR